MLKLMLMPPGQVEFLIFYLQSDSVLTSAHTPHDVERLAVFVDRRRKNAKTRKERDFSVPHVFINKLQVILGLL